MPLNKEATDDFRRLLGTYKKAKIEFPQLKLVSFAQWTLECGWGTTKLARDHLNFGGAKWRKYMKPWSTPVMYTPHAGDAEGTINYCKFKSHEEWIAGYWGRFDVEPAYKGWRNHTKTGREFIEYIGPTWVGTGPKGEAEYVAHVMRLVKMISDEFHTENKDEDSNGLAYGDPAPWDRML